MTTPNAPAAPPDSGTTLELLPESGPVQQLMVLLHGVGATPAQMLSLARTMRAHFPQAAYLIPAGWDAHDVVPGGRQWFSLTGITEENRVPRVAASVPRLTEWVKQAQLRLKVDPAATALIGFSQGAILSLEAVAADPDLAGRVLAFSGRYARLPEAAPPRTTLHLFHGSDDAVIPVHHSQEALNHLSSLPDADVTLDIAEGIGHDVHAALVDSALHRLTHHIPLRIWRAALSQAEG